MATFWNDSRKKQATMTRQESGPRETPRHMLQGNAYALPYGSSWMRVHTSLTDTLQHVNCCYLSTSGTPPTLLALKRHAQSLCQLIRLLSPSLDEEPVVVDAASAGPQTQEAQPRRQGRRHEAFDFLEDLETPYWSDDPSHHSPLNSLLNEVEGDDDMHGITYHCPLSENVAEVRAAVPGARLPLLPYASHHNLVMHANECLERLDHEFSTTGGLLSILPTTEKYGGAERADAANSLLGQWLTYTQHLVGRMHELERSYANALDLLAGQSVIPLQHLSNMGPEGRALNRAVKIDLTPAETGKNTGCVSAFPQDRWILANAGDDVFTYIHAQLDRAEQLHQHRHQAWHAHGVVGPHSWSQPQSPDGDPSVSSARGIISISITTRYFRVVGSGSRSPIFVLPAWEHHPGTHMTRVLEARPTVIAAVPPIVPVSGGRATALEERVEARLAAAAEAIRQRDAAVVENVTLRADLATAQREAARLRRAVGVLEEVVGVDVTRVAQRMDGMQAEAKREAREMRRLERLVDEVGREVEEVRRAEAEAAERADRAEARVRVLEERRGGGEAEGEGE